MAMFLHGADREQTLKALHVKESKGSVAGLLFAAKAGLLPIV
jgi:hypothetical protein